ncbi:hypothetical protein WN943_025862 [Citrus x changshan-huyou]
MVKSAAVPDRFACGFKAAVRAVVEIEALITKPSEYDDPYVIDEEDLVRGLVVHDNMSKHTNDNEQESNIGDASISTASHIAPYKEDIDSHLDIDSRLDIITQYDNKNINSESDVSDIDINDKKAFHESCKMMFAK